VSGLPFAPISASTIATSTDRLFDALLAASAVILLLVFCLLVGFSIRYRRGSAARRGPLPAILQREFEIGWTVATLFAFLFFFWWAGASELSALVPPKQAMEIHIVAKQWMWKAQHPNGLREINVLHAPVDEPVRLVMTSQDVIHSFFVPEFRIKQDVLPQRYTEAWFRATKTGTFHLFCTAFCGTGHSAMIGEVVVMSKPDFAAWLAAQPGAEDLASRGKGLFIESGCAGCHTPGGPVHAPNLAGIYGRSVPLSDGRTAFVDEAYIRDCILEPHKNVPAGYAPIMPSFKGKLDDGQILALTTYIRSLSGPKGESP
jgi:cytochrome c oxidase subunit II